MDHPDLAALPASHLRASPSSPDVYGGAIWVGEGFWTVKRTTWQVIANHMFELLLS